VACLLMLSPTELHRAHGAGPAGGVPSFVFAARFCAGCAADLLSYSLECSGVRWWPGIHTSSSHTAWHACGCSASDRSSCSAATSLCMYTDCAQPDQSTSGSYQYRSTCSEHLS
jgi:hypothetical protein